MNINPKRDLIDRLDEWAGTFTEQGTASTTVMELQQLLAEASDEIRSLRAEIAYLSQQIDENRGD